mgnify:CR=1 FL=1
MTLTLTRNSHKHDVSESYDLLRSPHVAGVAEGDAGDEVVTQCKFTLSILVGVSLTETWKWYAIERHRVDYVHSDGIKLIHKMVQVLQTDVVAVANTFLYSR